MNSVASEPKLSPHSVLAAPRRPVARFRPWVIGLIGVGVILLVGLGFMVAFSGGPRPAAVETPAPIEAPAPDLDLGRRLPLSYDDARARGLAEHAPVVEDAAAVTTPAADPSAQADTLREQERAAAQASGPFFAAAAVASPTTHSPGSTNEPPASALAAPPARSTQEQFIAAANASAPDQLPIIPRAPLSPYEIKAGSVIPAALVTGLNSDLPGPVIAQVTEPVFDHLTGRRVLIPQGARLIGRYDSQVGHGQDRLLVVWTRIVFPDGRSLAIGAMTGADASGAGGLADQIDTHVPTLARAIGLSTLIAVGASAAQNSIARSSGSVVLEDAASGIATSASQVGQQVVGRDLGRSPTLRVRPGWPLRLIVDKDIALLP